MPVNLDSEQKLDPEVKNWLAFAKQKLQELQVLGQALNQGRASVQRRSAANAAALAERRTSPRVDRPEVQAAVARFCRPGPAPKPLCRPGRAAGRPPAAAAAPHDHHRLLPETADLRRGRGTSRREIA